MNPGPEPIGVEAANPRGEVVGRGSDSAPFVEPDPDREALIDDAIALFGARYRRQVGREEARQLTVRLTAFFDVLAEWDRGVREPSFEGDVAA